jgi:DNA recombination protein RmuC
VEGLAVDATLSIILALLAGAALGALIGWLYAGRDGAAARQTVDSLRLQLDEVVRERDANRSAANDLAAVRAAQLEREKAFEEKIAELVKAREELSAQFAEVGGKLLETAQKQFLERADQRFRQSEETAGTNLKALLQPVHERLQRYEEAVGKVEEERRKDFGLLSGHIEAMKSGTERVSAEAAKLVNALRNAPKARGRWGEQQLKNVLESCGLTEHCDFETEVSRTGDDGGRLRPDVILRVPGGQSLVIDAKVSLNAYQDAFGAVDEAERALHLTAHAQSIKTHVNTLGNKAYWAQFDDAPDYVVMFIPGEHFLTAALEQDGALWDYAFDRRVLLATPTNLIAIARTVAAVWRQERLAKEARQIGELGKELYDRLAKALNDLRLVGTGLNTAVKNFNTFANSLESRALVSARKLKEFNVATGPREIEAVPPIEALASHADDKILPPHPSNEDDAAA